MLLLFILKLNATDMEVHAIVLTFPKSNKKAFWTNPRGIAQ